MNIQELSGVLEMIQDVTREEAMAIGEAVNQRMRILARFRQVEASVGFRVGDRVQFEFGRGGHRKWIRGIDGLTSLPDPEKEKEYQKYLAGRTDPRD